MNNQDHIEGREVEYQERREIELADHEYLDDIRDPARTAKGMLRGCLLGIPFWLLIIGIVALVKACTGGG